MAQAAEKIIEFPAGGIANFYMEDDEIAALEREEAKKQFGNKGIANFSAVAERMASYGRYGDDTLAHVETGELIIPKDLINDNPKLRDSIFEHLEELGVEDPERYVVGSGANSINPDTGLPEFFKFIRNIVRGVKKTVKKVTKAVKKVAKKVVKVVKKAAPIILPFVLGPAGLGLNMMYAGALGAGIGTLIQGGDLKQAFTAALVGGAIGGVSQGVQSGFAAGKGNFMKGFTQGVKNVATNPMQSSFTQAMSASLQPAAVADATAAGSVDAVTTDAGLDAATRNELYGVRARPAATVDPNAVASEASSFTDFMESPAGSNLNTGGGDGILDSFKDYSTKAGDILFRGGKDAETLARAASQAKQEAIQNTLLELGHQGPLATAPATIASEAIAAGKAAAAGAGPGMLATYGPSAALAGAGLYAAGAFDRPEEPPQEEMPTGMEYLEQDPLRYGLASGVPTGTTGDIVVASDYQQGYGPRIPYLSPFVRPMVSAAEGGEIFPRRVGGIMPNEGTPGKDSVRAMLMPGEFVMTTNAVKGLGDGDNDKGINRMYDMMRGLEAKGRAMA